jgi:hypothetical protein
MEPATVVGTDQVVGVPLSEQVGAVAGDPVRRAPLHRPLASKGKLDHDRVIKLTHRRWPDARSRLLSSGHLDVRYHASVLTHPSRSCSHLGLTALGRAVQWAAGHHSHLSPERAKLFKVSRRLRSPSAGTQGVPALPSMTLASFHRSEGLPEGGSATDVAPMDNCFLSYISFNLSDERPLGLSQEGSRYANLSTICGVKISTTTARRAPTNVETRLDRNAPICPPQNRRPQCGCHSQP